MPDAMPGATRDATLIELCRRLADPTRLAGGGVAAAASAALAASLAELVVALSMKRRVNQGIRAELAADMSRLARLRDQLVQGADADIAAFVNLMEEQRSARTSGERAAYRAALQVAAASPLELADSALVVLRISAKRIPAAAPFAASDLVAAAALAGGAIDAALAMAEVNLELMRSERDPALDAALASMAQTRARIAVEAATALERMSESTRVDHDEEGSVGVGDAS